MTTDQILLILMTHAGDNMYSLSAKANVAQPTIFRIITGQSVDPRSATLKKIAQVYGVKESTLRGESTIPDELKEVFDYYSVPVNFQQAKKGLKLVTLPKSSSIAHRNSVGDSPQRNSIQMLVNNHVVQSFLIDTLNQQSQSGGFQTLDFHRVEGDSMEPTYRQGDLVAVDTATQSIQTDGVFVFVVNNRKIVKRANFKMNGQIELSSDNPNIKSVDVLDNHSQAQVYGRVLWALSCRSV